jgi:23S rRNA pseudouridine2605 synthase
MSGFEGERIAKVIARAGICSRRDAERMIADGRVSLNGKTLSSPAVNVTETDIVTIDGKPLPQKQQSRLWRYHKPPGLVVSHRDPEGRPTVFEAVAKELPRVVSIGRLDFNTEGLLLLTNDGELARLLELPATGWVRRYRVRVHGSPDPAVLTKLAGGISIDGVHYGPIEASVDKIQGSNAWLTFAIREGKNREVKKVCEHLGLQVNRLIRTSFGPFQLGDLERGAIAEVPARVLAEQLGRKPAQEAHADRRRQA